MAPSTSSASLQIPSMDPNAGSSRQYNHSGPSSASAARPTSVAAHTTSSSQNQSSSSRRQRASHTVVSPSSGAQTSHQPQHDESLYPDVYSHPAAVAYAAAHPRRTIPKFGPYLLLQTLGEGEFGKVKLGLHHQWGEEVAVKLIRRGNVDSSVRMSKVEREIEVLKSLKHSNIVRLYDVIETDKYIGIILECASGGELFDHILAHRYLRERDAAKLFSQLISGVWYIHQKKIVHRDLKLENLLLDRNRNVIITDFGFANRFEHRSDDLMQTSCGSPCYAAPELVISEGLYVGSAVDIWSCGVILYAMLAGYLPFDDDPANPDGDNINLLYKYIVSTPLSFPDYISQEARDLLSMMLVPDPTRRTTLDGVMRHPWLAAYHATRTDGQPNAFGKTVEELEKIAMDQHHQKRQAYQRQMRANAIASGQAVPSPSRTQSHRPEQSAPRSSSRSRSTQPEYLYDSSADQSMMSPAPPTTAAVATTPTQNGARKTYGSPAALGLAEDDPFAGPGGSPAANLAVAPPSSAANASNSNKQPRASEDARANNNGLSPNPPATTTNKSHKANSSGGGGSGFRHTIQVEYDDPSKSSSRRSEDKRRDRSGSQGQTNGQHQQHQNGNGASSIPTPTSVPAPPVKERRPSQSGPKPLPPSPPVNAPSSYRGVPPTQKVEGTPSSKPRPAELNGVQPEGLIVNVSSPPVTPNPAATPAASEHDKDTGSQTSASSVKGSGGHKRGKSSLDRIGLGKIFGGSGSSSGTPASPVPPLALNGSSTTTASTHSQSQDSGAITPVPSDGQRSTSSVLLSPQTQEKEKEGAKTKRRNTLTVMVEPISRTIRNRKGKMSSTPMTADGASAANGGSRKKEREKASPQPHTATLPPSTTPAVPDTAFSPTQDLGSAGMQASTNKAKKVMQWFRTKSKGRESLGFGTEDEGSLTSTTGTFQEKDGAAGTPTQTKYRKGFSASSSTLNQPVPQTALGLSEAGRSPHVVVTTPTSAVPRPLATPNTGHPPRSASTNATESISHTPSFVTRFRNSVTAGGGGGSGGHHHHDKDKSAHPNGQLRIHHGAVDQTTITTRPPPEVMAHVKKVLEGMGVEIQLESEFKYRCIRGKKKKVAAAAANAGGDAVAGQTGGGGGGATGLAAVTIVGSAASNGVDKRGLPLPSPSAFSGTGGMLRGLLMRRQSSQVSAHGSSQPNLAFDDENSVVVSEPLVMSETTYGDPSQDAGDEVRFSVELTRLDRLNDTFSLDIRRLKGNLRSYKYLYDTLRERADLSATQA